MPAKQHQARSSFKHYGRTITVEMVNPKVGLDGRVNVQPGRYIYRIPFNKRGAVVDVVGVITHATFKVTGWIHPIRLSTYASWRGSAIYVKHIEIGYKQDPDAVEMGNELELDKLPIGKIREHAIRAATFTGKLKTRKSNKTKVGTITIGSNLPYLRIKELDLHPITEMRIGGKLPNRDLARFPSKMDLEQIVYTRISHEKALSKVRDLYNTYYQLGRDAAGYITCAEYISIHTGRPPTTCQQQIAMCRKIGLLPKATKQKRGTK